MLYENHSYELGRAPLFLDLVSAVGYITLHKHINTALVDPHFP